jgi:phosphoglycerol transferase MdoB-like AlkP superfamily enzyme
MFVLIILMTAYRFFFFFHYRPQNRPFSGSAFLLGLRYDARIVCIIGVAMFILNAFPFLNPFKNRKALKGWLILLSVAFLIMLIFYSSDFYYYDYLKQRLNASVLGFLQDAGISGKMMWETYPLVKIFFFIILALFLFYFGIKRIFTAIKNTADTNNKNKVNITFYMVTILLMALLVFGKIGQYPLRWSDAFAFQDEFKANTALNPFQSFFSSIKFRNSTFDINKVKADYPLMADYLGVKDKDSVMLNYKRSYHFDDTLVNKPNIVIVICESFSAYKSSMFGNGLNATPYFNSMCNNGVFFERCFTPSFGTARGVWAVVTGIPDVETKETASRNPSAVDQHTIFNDFTNYNKFYFLGGSTTWANIKGVLTNNIMELKIYEQEDFKANKVDVWGISDKNLFLETNKILASQTKPFISIIQTADNHRPYTIPEEDGKEFKKLDLPADTLSKYGFDDNGQLNAFRYTDFCYSKFIEAAKKEKYFDNTIFVFVGDHGLKGDAGNMFPQSFTKQGILAQHVPLLFYAPKLLAPKRVLNVASQLDILPSVATLARQSYTNTTMGRNLFDTTDAASKFAFLIDPDKLVIESVSNQYYYGRSLRTNKIDFVSVVNNSQPVDDSAKNHMAKITEAWYETARYMLLNNKKNK